jgi:hypothetical protein
MSSSISSSKQQQQQQHVRTTGRFIQYWVQLLPSTGYFQSFFRDAVMFGYCLSHRRLCARARSPMPPPPHAGADFSTMRARKDEIHKRTYE